MSDSIASLSVDVGAKDNITSFLARLETQLDRSNTTLERVAKSMEAELGRSTQKAGSDALSLARAQATLDANTGKLEQAITGLSRAIQAEGASTVATIRAENQLATLKRKLTVETETSKRSMAGWTQVLQGAKSGAISFAGGLGLATTAVGTAIAVWNRAKEGFELRATLDEQRRSIGILLGDVERGNRVFADAAKFGRQYGFTQREMGESAEAAADLIRKSTVATEKQLEVLARLASRNSKEGFSGAVFSTKELQSGDITSIVERFNVARSSARAMKEEIAKGADVFVVLDKYLNSVNITADVLNNRLKGAAGATRTYAQAQESLTLAMGTFAEGPGVKMLDILSKITSNTATALSGDEQANQLSQQVLQQAQSFEQYNQTLGEANQQLAGIRGFVLAVAPAFAGLVPTMTVLSQAQYNYAQSLLQSGVSAADATAKAQAMNDVLVSIGEIQAYNATAGELSAQALDALSNSILRVAGSSPEAEANVVAMIAAWQNGAISAEELQAAIAKLEAGLKAKAEASALVASEDSVMIAQMGNATNAAQDAADAALNDAQAKETEAAQTALLQEKTRLAAEEFLRLNPNIANSGSASVTAANGVSEAVAQFINLQLQAARARAELAALQIQAGAKVAFGNYSSGRAANDDVIQTRGQQQAANQEKANKRYAGYVQAQRDGILVTGTAAQQQAEYNRRVQEAVKAHGTYSEEAERARTELKKFQQQQEKAAESEAKKGKKKGGGAEKLSDQEKVNNKLLSNQDKFDEKFEDEEAKHLLKRAEIQRDFYDKMLAAQNEFNLDRASGEADFYESTLPNIKNEDVKKQLDAQYQQILARGEEIAREKGADAGQAYIDSETAILEKNAKLLDKIASLRSTKKDDGSDKTAEEINSDANEAEYLEGVKRLREREAEVRRQQVAEEGSQIAAEREKQLQDEDRRYEEATGKLADHQQNAQDRIVADAKRGKKAIDEQRLSVDQLGESFDKVNQKGGKSSAQGGDAASKAAATSDTPTTNTTPAPDSADLSKLIAAVEALRADVVGKLGDVVAAEEQTTSAVRNRGEFG